MKIKIAILILGVCGKCASWLAAQGATATILGTVTDATGASVPEASGSNPSSTPRQIQFGLKLNF